MDTSRFTFEGKALSAIELADGDLLLEGMAVVFDGLDREGEQFAPGCLRRGLKAFLEGSAPLVFHHRTHAVLGKVLEMTEVPGGISFRARVDGAIKNHPELGAIYQQIKKATLTGISLGGYFQRLGNRIVNVDPVELSITGTPVCATPAFAVVEGRAIAAYEVKSLLANANDLVWLRSKVEDRNADLARLQYEIGCARLNVRPRS